MAKIDTSGIRNETGLDHVWDIRGEFIGGKCKILKAQDQGLVDRTGWVVYETKNTLHIQEGRQKFVQCLEKRPLIVSKQGTVVEFIPYGSTQAYRVSLDAIRYRPEDRMKKIRFKKVRKHGRRKKE